MSLCASDIIFGTMQREGMEENDPEHEYMTAAVKTALDVGYRHFDLAEIYSTQVAVGRALNSAISAGSVKREDLFLINKLDGLPGSGDDDRDYASTKQRVLKMLEQVGVDYFDLLLIHYPLKSGTGLDALAGDPSQISSLENWTLFCDHLEVSWKQMSLLQQEGLVKNIGLSNCYLQHVETLNKLIISASLRGDNSLMPIFAVQNFIDAAHDEADFVHYCQKQHIRCISYRPVVFIPTYTMLDGAISELQLAAQLVDLENEYQAVLYWLLSQGITPVVTSMDRNHMMNNMCAAHQIQKDAASEESDEKLTRVKAIIRNLSEQHEMINMIGGCDEYALSFKNMIFE